MISHIELKTKEAIVDTFLISFKSKSLFDGYLFAQPLKILLHIINVQFKYPHQNRKF